MARGFNYAPGASAEVQEAMQPDLDKAKVLSLGASRNNLVRATIASRQDCPLGLMVTLAHDFSAEVRCCVARNALAPRTVMAYLSADRSVDVVKALVENPSLSAELLEELAFHKKGDVRAAAAARLDGTHVPVARASAEDIHTPELAEHVVPIQQRMTADGTLVSPFAPVNVVDITTGAPLVPSAPTPPPAPVFPMPGAGATPTPDEWRAPIPQIFSPHSTPNAPAPTRTAPVRGFKPKP